MGDDPHQMFADFSFYIVDCPQKAELVRLVKSHGGEIADPNKRRKSTIIYVAPPTYTKEDLQNLGDVLVMSINWIYKCVEAGGLIGKDQFVLQELSEEGLEEEDEENQEEDKTGVVGKSQGREVEEEDMDDADEDDKDDSKKGAKKGEKLHPWTGAEFKILIDYARKNRDSFGVSGNKLWERAEEENILPGRTMQAMRECAKRKRAFIEMDELPSGKPRSGPTPLELAITHLSESSGQDLDSICWALYQCNGEFKRAKKILYGEITLSDFHPWSCDEDEVIAKFARGLLMGQSVSAAARHDYVANVHNVTDEIARQEIHLLLQSRDYHEIAARAKYLSNEKL